jgi:hypothetical protein
MPVTFIKLIYDNYIRAAVKFDDSLNTTAMIRLTQLLFAV